MADKSKKSEPKIILEREYIVPLRREWLKVATYKRANKAVKALKEFMVKHMKIYDRDLRKIRIENVLNNEIRYRGMKHPPAKIKVRAIKYDNEIVRVELVDVPDHVKFARIKEDEKKGSKKGKKEEEIKKEDAKEEKNEEKKEADAKEKEQASKEESLKLSASQAKEQRHISKDNNVMMPRKTLSR